MTQARTVTSQVIHFQIHTQIEKTNKKNKQNLDIVKQTSTFQGIGMLGSLKNNLESILNCLGIEF